MAEKTTIELSAENWQWLNAQKRPGESFDDVLSRLRTGDAPEAVSGSQPLPDDLDLPGSGDTLERRRATIARLYDHLQTHGTATKSDFLELVDAEEVGLSTPESFWSNCVKGTDSLRSLPGVDPPGEGEHTWRYSPSAD